MNLHGHTRIELTDIGTGEKQIYEDDNIVTNALQDMLDDMTYFRSPLLNIINNQPLSNHINVITRGLMLFDQQIEEDPETIYPPAGVSMVGCGAGVSYSGNNLMAGSYNNTESGKVENGWKHVWDFATHQANGTIACAALTTQAGGKVTAGNYPYSDDYKYGSGTNLDGNDDYLYRTGTYIVPKYTETNSGGDYGQHGILYIDGKNERMLRVHDAQSICTNYFSRTTDGAYEYNKRSVYYKKSIEIDIYKMAFQSVSLFDVNNGKSYEDGLINTVTVEMPQQLKNLISDEDLNRANYYWIPFIGCSDGYIYLALRIPGSAGNNPLVHGEEFYIWQISVEDFSSEYFVLTNSTGENIAWNTLNALNSRTVLVTADYVFAASSSRKIYSINRKDGSAKELKFPDGISMNMSYLDKAVFFKGKLYICETSYTYIYDPITEEMRIKNYVPVYDANLGKMYEAYGKNMMLYTNSAISSSQTVYLQELPDPARLITINNLLTPVTKTASQTMKVTYTLTKEDD